MIINASSQTYDIHHLVCDFNGTIAIDGELIDGVGERFARLAEQDLNVYVITADTHGTAQQKLANYQCTLELIGDTQQDVAKQAFVKKLGAEHVCAIGNGTNDRLMLADAALGFSVRQAEGASSAAENAANVRFNSILDALDFLLMKLRAKATLRV
jgi:P-type E1-E2 ATPase